MKTIGRIKTKGILWFYVGTLILLGCEVFFLRNILFSDALFGDEWDGRLTMLFTEHWYHVFRGESTLTDMGFFYPASNTLAYSDMFLAHGLIHSLLRFLGFDIFDAFKTTLILIHLLGTLNVFYLLLRELKVDLWWALFGTITFSFTSTFSIHVAHTQLLGLSFVPLLAIFVVRYFRFFAQRGKRIRNAVLAVFTLALLLYTAWYIFFYTVLFVTVGFVIWLICTWTRRKIMPFGFDSKLIKYLIPEILLLGMLLVALMVPFALIELPILKMSGGRSYGEVLVALPEAIDLINVSTDNWLMGPLLSAMRLGDREYTFEVIEGFSIVLVVVFIISLLILHRQNKDILPANGCEGRYLIRILAVTAVVNISLMLRLSSNGVSFWWLIYQFFPGAKSIRAVARYLLYLSFPLAVATAMMGYSVSDNLRKRTILYAPLMVLLIGVAFVANIHNGGVFARWSKAENLAFIDNVPAPPKDCESFYLSNVIEGQSGPYYQLDAYQIADKYGIKTIHGYSGLSPTGWSDMWDVQGSKYKSAVKDWIIKNQLENVYAYDEVERTWTKFDVREGTSTVFDAYKKIIPETVSGILDNPPEGDYSWTSQKAIVILHNHLIGESGLRMKVGTVREKYMMQNPELEPECKVYVNGIYVDDLKVTDDVREYLLDVDASKDDYYETMIETNCYYIPNIIGENGDGRELSLQLYYLGN